MSRIVSPRAQTQSLSLNQKITHFLPMRRAGYPCPPPSLTGNIRAAIRSSSRSSPRWILSVPPISHLIFIIFCTVQQVLFTGEEVWDIHRDITWGVLVDLLKDGEIWLWVDGDEEKCAYSSNTLWYESFKAVKHKLSCSSLWLHIPRTPTWINFRERVSKASFAMRASVIIWAALTSVAVREAGWVRGLADWTRCGVWDTVSIWYEVGPEIWHWLRDQEQQSDFQVGFEDTLRYHGHSCYRDFEQATLKHWFDLQSFLRTTHDNVSRSLLINSITTWDAHCWQCHNQLYIPFHS